VDLQYVRPSYYYRLLMTNDVGYLFGEPPPPRDPKHKLIPGRCMSGRPVKRNQLDHPCSRQLTHVRWQVHYWAAADDIIVDPFCGSGTTLLAASMAGNRSIGIEYEERYCEITAHKLSRCQRELFLNDPLTNTTGTAP
jgi:hypothetical protein